jgi:RNA ligase (TIGR02306 family)
VSTFACEVVPVELTPHANAEKLSIVRVYGSDVVVRTEDWLGRDRGVHVPVDAVVPVDRPEFAFLAAESKDGKTCRIKARRLRGVFSMGMLVPAPVWVPIPDKPGGSYVPNIGDDLSHHFGVTKYEEPEVIHHHRSGFPMLGSHDQAEEPGGLPVPRYTDIEHVRRHGEAFYPGELVVVTEKIHGANARYTYRDGRIHTGSRKQWKTLDVASAWYRALTVPMLRLCGENSPLVLYGEVFGQGVQDLAYGSAEPRFVAFDLYDPRAECYLDFAEFRAICLSYSVPMAPILYAGAYDADAVAVLAERDSEVAGNGQISEGVVVRPMFERRTHALGRVVLKRPGERYYLRDAKTA